MNAPRRRHSPPAMNVHMICTIVLSLCAHHFLNGYIGTITSLSSFVVSAEQDTSIYESKIQNAMNHYMEQSEELLYRAVGEGGANAASVQVNANGEITSSSEEELQMKFAERAVEEELTKLNEIKKKVDAMKMMQDRSEDEEVEDEEEYGYDYDDEEYEYGSEDEDDEEDNLIPSAADPNEPAETKKSQYGDDDVQDELAIKNLLDPEEWYKYSYWELHAYFSCAAEFKKSKDVYPPERWIDLRDFYHEFTKEDLEEFPIPEGEPERSYQYTEGSYDPPMETFQSGYKGRGLKASRDIKEGELVFQATNNTVIFTHGHTWRKFLFSIYERYEDRFDSETTCDVLVWSWIQRLVPGGPLVIVMDIDNGSLMNEGREEPGWEKPNIKCGKDGWCDFDYFAIKDIRKGEEILCDYREFAMLNAWNMMGL
ncbi:predicted protein [Thalassiosira pseudonana CCMP1335]|uniref:SET domain-containing protein n=1 Tax=Thalassiosira pseudonana TaxID=35128 RepID=B8LCZ4_THAPS|nr:predicted protein [Thalassiosira pseudonana CCMP1335]EED86622.1 predicted protein [Thalassiosira pseudonana CCMP1335]